VTSSRRLVGLTVVAVVAVAVGVVLAGVTASGRPILASRWSLLWALAAWAAAWVVGVFAVLRLPVRVALPLVMVGAVALRLAALAGPPTTSDDLYRYSWDGRVQLAGHDPYVRPPQAASLVGLREPWLWPDAHGCAVLHRPAGCTRINRPSDRTIYPPVAEAWFAAAYRLGGIGARYKVWQVAGLVTEVVVLGGLVVALRRWDADCRWVALYALSPAPVLEIVNNGHVDGLAVAFIVAALAVAGGPRSGPARRPAWVTEVACGGLIGLAAMVKLYPAVLLVALAGLGVRQGPVRAVGPHGPAAAGRLVGLVRAGLAALAVTVVAYLPHVVVAGGHVLGYLPGYLKEEHYRGGGRFLLAAALHVPAAAAGAVSVGAVLVLVAWVLWRGPAVPRAAALLLAAILLVTSPVQPWYAVSLLAVATVAVRPRWGLVVAAGYPYFFAVILDHRHQRGLGQLGFAAAVVGVVAAATVAAHRGRSAARDGGDVEQPAAGEPAVAGRPAPGGEGGGELA